VTALALASELTVVDVVLRMAGRTIGLQLHAVRRLTVTGIALEALVSTDERKAGGLGVVEAPETPAVRRVTVRALATERALVTVIPFVARVAIRGRARNSRVA
jgi:hypothetical protein